MISHYATMHKIVTIDSEISGDDQCLLLYTYAFFFPSPIGKYVCIRV